MTRSLPSRRGFIKPARMIELVFCTAVILSCLSFWRYHQPTFARSEQDRTPEVAERAFTLAKESRLAADPTIAPLLVRGPVLVDPIGTYSLRDRTPRAVPSYIKSAGQVLANFSTVEPSKASTDLWDSLSSADAYCWAYIVERDRLRVIVYRGRSAPETFKNKTEIERTLP